MSISQIPKPQSLSFIDSKAVTAKPEFYTKIEIDIAKIIQNWRLSVFSYEWLNPDGSIKPLDALKDKDQIKRQNIEDALRANTPLDIPVLGIGIQDNVEIGSGKALLMTLLHHGVRVSPAHIPQSNREDFKDFLANG
ncbi:MAG: hypothetical protein ACPGRX_00985 [Bdellovibrionales bacterium]